MIPMVDLHTQYQSLKAGIDAGIQSVLDNTHFILGENVRALEAEIADYLGAAHAVSCASGTDALHLALLAAGIGPGDEVITTPFTFIATAEAIAYVGATAVFVDIDPATFNLDVNLAEAAITDKTRAILPVHLFGQACDIPALSALCEKHGLLLIEDCAQSFGGKHGDRFTGTFGAAGCYSFFPSKNLGAFGDGGLVTTNDDALADRLRMYRNHGSRKQYVHEEIGYNSRLDELQAVILRQKLPHIDEFNAGRRRVAHRYSRNLADLPVQTPAESADAYHVYHQYTLLLDDRAAVQEALREQDIASAVYYPIPLHKQEAIIKHSKVAQALPVAEQTAARCLSLPVYPELSDDNVDRITEVIRRVLA
ncbi:DegT/DnrJ/EryC1/StrS family aminotransferase [Granulosicoccaceae sp. 1_MG-2023]|nr:DegT/DnrJ/EryC1/StrS family aminotransferase [Granulosicoccaceae sp. 1_MG-2023]